VRLPAKVNIPKVVHEEYDEDSFEFKNNSIELPIYGKNRKVENSSKSLSVGGKVSGSLSSI